MLIICVNFLALFLLFGSSTELYSTGVPATATLNLCISLA
jgi:hypothetical protein